MLKLLVSPIRLSSQKNDKPATVKAEIIGDTWIRWFDDDGTDLGTMVVVGVGVLGYAET